MCFELDVFLLVQLLLSVICEGSPTFENVATYQDQLCSPISHQFGHVRSRIYCAVLCETHSDCFGFFHSPSQGSCRGINFVPSSQTTCTYNATLRFYRKTGIPMPTTSSQPPTTTIATTTVAPTLPATTTQQTTTSVTSPVTTTSIPVTTTPPPATTSVTTTSIPVTTTPPPATTPVTTTSIPVTTTPPPATTSVTTTSIPVTTTPPPATTPVTTTSIPVTTTPPPATTPVTTTSIPVTTTPPPATTPVTTTPRTTTTTASVAYNMSCSSSSDCSTAPNTACLDGTCQCQPGYKLTPSLSMCSTDCVTYGSTFIKLTDTGLMVTSSTSYTGLSVADCATHCVKMTSCTGFNYGHDMGPRCSMKEVTNPQSSDWSAYNRMDHYVRNCA